MAKCLGPHHHKFDDFDDLHDFTALIDLETLPLCDFSSISHCRSDCLTVNPWKVTKRQSF